MPAGAPTVQSKPQSEKQSTGANTKPAGKAEPSRLSEKQKSKIKEVVQIYASWPGPKPISVLVQELKQQQPLITSGAITKLEGEMRLSATTFSNQVKDVNVEPGLTALGGDPNAAFVMVYVDLNKHFTPVDGSPYTKSSTQPYMVKMHVIKRSWRIVDITPDVSQASSGT
jgi:hypothetical protein